MTGSEQLNIIVAGAGAFGGWTALELQKSGATVTLVDMAEPGNGLSSSGGESRVIRHVYDRRIYVDMAARALELWKQADKEWGQQLLHQNGVLFMSDGDPFIHDARAHMDAAGVDYDWLDKRQLAERYPQINPDGVSTAIYEPEAGYIDARRSCAVVRDAFVRAGGACLTGRIVPTDPRGGAMQGVTLNDGRVIGADVVVFACGPWLKNLFPGLLKDNLRITRQELYFFEVPEPCRESALRDLPVWADVGKSFWYGIPAPHGMFKIADDTNGAEVNPDTQSRTPTRSGIDSARRYMEFRFPGMTGARFADSRVCQYSMTPDHDFILDQHPEAGNAWLLGGGSGHGFKHGPAIGEMAAKVILGELDPPGEFSLDRW